MKTLKTRLKNGLENCYLLEGEDYYLYDRAFAMIKKACNIAVPDFDFVKFDDENFSMQALVDSAEVLPLAGQYRLIVVKNVSKISENDKKLFLDFLKKTVPSTVIVIYDYLNKFDFAKDKVAFVDCRRFDKKLGSAVVVNELSKLNKQISAEALDTLWDYCNGYLTRINNELYKLAYYDLNDPLITKKLVESMVKKDNEFVVYELTDSLSRRDGDKVLQIVDKLSKEQGIIGLITNHFRRLFFISTSDMSDKQLASLLGVKEFAISKQRQQVKNFSRMQLKKIYTLLEKVDYDIKSGAMLQENALYYLVLSILYI